MSLIDEIDETVSENDKYYIVSVASDGRLIQRKSVETCSDFLLDSKEIAIITLCRLLTRARDELARREWQPIETAPMDGTRVILARIESAEAAPEFNIKYRAPYVWWACSGCWSDRYEKWWDGIEPSGLNNPTHYLLFPVISATPDEG